MAAEPFPQASLVDHTNLKFAYAYDKVSASWVNPPFERMEVYEGTRYVSRTFKSAKRTSDGVRPTEYSFVKLSVTGMEPWLRNVSGSGGVNWWSRDYPYFSGGILPMLTVPQPFNTHQTVSGNDVFLNRVRTKALANFVDGDINLGATVVELRETSNYFAQYYRKYAIAMLAIEGDRKAVRYVKRNMKKLRFTPGWGLLTFSQRWLEWRYAIMPILNDMEGIMNVLRKGIDAPIMSITTSSKYKDVQKFKITPSGWVGNVDVHTDYRCKLVANIADHEAFARAKLGLDVRGAAWEAVPFSFVIDWGIKVGVYFQALAALKSGIKFDHGFTQFFRREFIDYHPSPMPSGVTREGYHNQRLDTYARKPMFQLPLPVVYTENPFSTDNVITAAALHVSLSSSKLPRITG